MLLTDFLNRTVSEFPDKAAFTDGERGYTFRELFDAAVSAASGIVERGIGASPVVIFMKKSPDEIAAFFSVLYSGNHYIPIDEEMPEKRIELILDNVKTRLIICDETTIEKGRAFVENGRAQSAVLWKTLSAFQKDEDALRAVRDRMAETDIAYVLFTSGSTGIPKGVACTHKSVSHYIEEFVKTVGITENTRFGEQAPLYFDASLKEIYSTVLTGATTLIVPRILFKNPVGLVEYLNEKDINTICWVVSAMTFVSGFNTFDTIVPNTIKTVTFVGEVFPIKQFMKWREALPDARMFNLYGPTECTGVSTYFEIPKGYVPTDAIPVGRPFSGTEIYLIEDGKEVKTPGETAEICICGSGVSAGYYNDPERTNEVFVQNPLPGHEEEKIYKTGDLGRYDDDGNLVFVSRKDYQIKHMGHRIELGEIEANVNLVAGVKYSVCTFSKESGRITLFYVGEADKDSLMKELKRSLQRYMLPNRIVKLDAMPYTATGKIDRKKLYEESD